jgi:hypothetical protein
MRGWSAATQESLPAGCSSQILMATGWPYSSRHRITGLLHTSHKHTSTHAAQPCSAQQYSAANMGSKGVQTIRLGCSPPPPRHGSGPLVVSLHACLSPARPPVRMPCPPACMPAVPACLHACLTDCQHTHLVLQAQVVNSLQQGCVEHTHAHTQQQEAGKDSLALRCRQGSQQQHRKSGFWRLTLAGMPAALSDAHLTMRL